MRIKNLHISGFKSFCHSVKIDFQQNGITVIVGPNGCGKSNVVDAIRWVLGEQSAKHLRGSGMEDVIFAGSAFQKPLGVAQVTITFSNLDGNILSKYRDFSEISVSRRLYRSGESIYMINKSPVRLLDVKELFMDTGIGSNSYAIIEQGKIGEIVSARPLDRRLLIEEAAGIVKYKTRRQTAERRMESTLQNLLRVDDVLQELHRQEETLQDQVEKANKFLALKEESQRIDQQLSTLRWQQALKKEKNAGETTKQYKSDQASLFERRGIQEKELEQLSGEMSKQGSQLETLREGGFQKETEIQEANNRRTLEQQNLKNNQEWIEQQTQEIDELRIKTTSIQEQLDIIQKENIELEQKHEKLQVGADRIEEDRKEESDILHALNEELQTFQERLLTIHTQLTNQTNQKGFLEDRFANLEERQFRVQEQIKNNQEHLGQATSKSSITQLKIQKFLNTKEELQKKIEELEHHIASQEESLINVDTTLQEQQYSYQTTLSHIESLEKIQDHYEDLDESVKNFLEYLNEFPKEKTRLGIIGVVAELISIEADIIPKIAPAMVDYLDLIIIEKASNLKDIEALCQERDISRLGFIPLDRNNFTNQPLSSKYTPLHNLIQFIGEGKKLPKNFFSQIHLIESDQEWQKLSIADELPLNLGWISPQGSYFSREGITKIGKPNQSSFGFLERKLKIEELTKTSKLLRIEVDQLTEQKITFKTQQEGFTKKFETEKAQYHECELDLSLTQKELEHDQLEQKRADELKNQLQADEKNINEEIENNRQKLYEIEESFVELEEGRRGFDQQMEHHQEAIQVQQRNVESLAEKLLSTRVALTGAYEQLKNKQSSLQRLSQEAREGKQRFITLENSEKAMTEKIKKTEKIIAQIDEGFDDLLDQRESLQVGLKEQTEVYNQMTEKRSLSSESLQNYAKELDSLMIKIHDESLKTTEQRMQREQIEQQLLNTYGQTPQELLDQLDLADLKEPQLASRLNKLRSSMNTMDNVNLGAPDEYAALQERIEFLGQQSDDLKKAVDDLKASIREINFESRKRFQETYDLINQHFKTIFVSLFDGGDAHMILTESEDVLEAGVDIFAQPPGKKLQNINLLSGGEKALTAISLIFAIFQIKPSPFCLLDEVDAPLDDINVGRFNNMIKQMTKNSQFIIITHNKLTMEIGNLLYGVTMGEPGVSQTVSVQFQEAASYTTERPSVGQRGGLPSSVQ